MFDSFFISNSVVQIVSQTEYKGDINFTVYLCGVCFCVGKILDFSIERFCTLLIQYTKGLKLFCCLIHLLFNCLVHPIFHFLFLVTFCDEVTKIRKCYVIFVCILQGKTGKTQNENHATKVTKIPKTIRRKYGMNETHVYSKN